MKLKILTLSSVAFSVITSSLMADEYGTNTPSHKKESIKNQPSLISDENKVELKKLANKVPHNSSENTRLMRLILVAAAKRDASFVELLKNKALLKSRNVELAIAAYDYNINKSVASLDKILAQAATDPASADVDSILVLGFVDEWDRSIRVFQKHFARGTDGTGAANMRGFLKNRAMLDPQKYAEIQKNFKFHRQIQKAYKAYLPKKAEDGADQPAAAVDSKAE